MCDKALFSWKLLNICLLMGSSKLIPYFALLMHITLLIKQTYFCLLIAKKVIKLSLS